MNSRVPLKPLAWYKKLATRKGRLASLAFLVEGERALRQIRQSQPESIVEIVHSEPASDWEGICPTREVTPSQMRAICQAVTPQVVAGVVQLPVSTYCDALPRPLTGPVLLLEDIQDPGNVGTLIRTAAGFNFSGMIMTIKCADPFAPKCVQATAGSVLSLWMRRTPNYMGCLSALKQAGYQVIAADLSGVPEPDQLPRSADVVLALGNEASGLSAALRHAADVRFQLPLEQTKAESLNVAVCGAICMYLLTQGTSG